MKRCPTCQRTYTDDSLSFCLQDGSLLLSVSDAPRGYDSDATLINPPTPDSRSDMPTEAFNTPPAPTILSPQPAHHTTPHQQRVTAPGSHDAAVHHAAATAAPPASSNRALTGGVIAIAVLLLALVGIGVGLLLRNSSEGGSESKTTNVDNKNSNANVNTNVNVNNNVSANTNANANASPAPTTANSPPASNNARANSNGSQQQPPPGDAAARVEAKILRDTPLTESDLAGLSTPVLRRLRNAVYARHGRTFNTPELQRYFDSRPWYKPRPDYTDQDLSPTDRANVSLIQAAEGGCQ